jgi:hypothetical protein
LNILESLVANARKKKQELENYIGGVHPNQSVAPPAVLPISPAGQARIAARTGRPAPTTHYTGSDQPMQQFNLSRAAGDSFKQAVPKVGRATDLAARRVGIDMAQGVTGLYDLASRGTGTNRVSKKLDKFAKNIDQSAKNDDVNPAYHIMQAPLEVASFFTPGVVAKGAGVMAKAGQLGKVGVKAAKLAEYASRAERPIVNVATRYASRLEKQGGSARRIVAAAVKHGATPSNAVNAAAGTGMDLGVQSGKGEDISRGDVAASVAMNAGLPFALPAAGQAGIEAVHGAAPTVKRTVKATQAAVQNAERRNNAVESVQKQLKTNQVQRRELNKRLKQANTAGLPTEHPEVRNIHAALEQNIQDEYAIRTQDPNRSGGRAVADKLLTARPGLSMKRVTGHEDLTPEQHNFIGQYAEMLKSTGSGNGVDKVRTEDGFKRVSNNSPMYSELYAAKGRKPSNADWFDYARKEIESGKAAYGASDEYKGLHNDVPAAEPLNAGNSPESTPEKIHFGGKTYTVTGTLETQGDTKYKLLDENGRELWTNQAGYNSGKAGYEGEMRRQATEAETAARVQQHEIEVDGHKINVTYDPGTPTPGGYHHTHLEFRTEGGNPVSDTGYRSHFMNGTPEQNGLVGTPEQVKARIQEIGQHIADENKPKSKKAAAARAKQAPESQGAAEPTPAPEPAKTAEVSSTPSVPERQPVNVNPNTKEPVFANERTGLVPDNFDTEGNYVGKPGEAVFRQADGTQYSKPYSELTPEEHHTIEADRLESSIDMAAKFPGTSKADKANTAERLKRDTAALKKLNKEYDAAHTAAPEPAAAPAPAKEELKTPDIEGALTPFDTPEIIQKRAEQAAIPSTHTDMSPQRVELREKVGQLLYQQGGHSDADKAPYKIKTNHRADIVLGPPASGKTNIVDPLLKDNQSRLIDSDEAKALLGDVNMAGALHQESDAITTDQLLRAAKRGDNIVLPLVGKNPERVRAAAQALKDAGYDIHLHYNHLDPELTAGRAVSRFQETGRFVDPHYVFNEVGLKPKASYDILKKDELFETYKHYDNNVPRGEKPRLVEQGRVRKGSNEAGRPLRESSSSQAQNPQKEVATPLKASTKERLDAVSARTPKAPGTSKLNVDRIKTSKANKTYLDKETDHAIGQLSHKEVESIAADAGIDTKTHSIDEQKRIIAEQLNLRKHVVGLAKQADEARKAGNTAKAARFLERAAEAGQLSVDQGASVARQLEARKIMANALATPQQRIFRLLDKAGVNRKTYTKHFADIDFEDTKAVVKAYRDLVPGKAADWLDTLRYNSMLSSPLTQGVNIFGNLQGLLVGAVEKNARGLQDAALGRMGHERKFARGEGTAYIKSAFARKTVKEARQNFADAFHGVGKYANTSLDENFMPLAEKGAKGAAYKALVLPMRVLDASDKFFRTLAETAEESALIHRENSGIKVKGDREAIKQAEADYRIFQTPVGTKGQGVVDDAFDKFASTVNSLRFAKNPLVSLPAKFSMPFVRTVNNMAKQGIVDYSPAGFVNMAGNVDKRTAFTRAVMGTAVFGASASMIAQGDMTWGEPRNKDEKAQFRQDGKQPYSVRIGGKWVNFSKLHPAVSFPMAMTAAIHDAIENKKIDQSTADGVLEGIAKYGQFLADQSFAKNIGDTLAAIGGDQEKIASAVGNYGQQLVPYRAFTGWLARMSDSTDRKINTDKGYIAQQVENLMQQYPVLRQNTTAREADGVPIAANNQVFNGISPVRVTNDRTNGTGGSYSASPAGKRDKNAWKAGFTTPAARKFVAMSEEQQKAAAATDPESRALYDQVQAAKKANSAPALRPAGLDSKTTKILDKYDRLTDKGRDNYFNNNKSAEAEYTAAKYESDKADGKLSRVEEIRRRQEVEKAAVGSSYDKEIRDIYGLSKSEIYTLVSTDPDGKSIADRLIKYGDDLEGNDLGDNKLRDSKGNIAIRPKSKGSGGGSSSSLVSLAKQFKTPYDELIKNRKQGANISRGAHLAKR